ncbi:hypothetical protein AMAG_00055 [Allomyces macrogynus ATCC 38327]|uniref:NmrA-like domain-containing protein n=1 Tax=Allomyces macrogynus (strain ATCC 38327) TaxID=578462 RepID=A0A0L0RUK6_ALLM3|nr:hypothetical protein AMAG_00055 [Allomyces macrogynus ATCC 38327]|eukprot:KNE54052.1 hypothetical protein AMAG_00055 [Allomyces macrogynus ATCC 38327]
MSANTIAIIGHRGFAGKQVVSALAASPAKHIKVLYRPGSSATDLPANVEAVEVDLADTSALTAALRGVDILISTVGAPGIADQIAWIPAIKAAGVKLFAPSDFALLYTPTERKAFGLIEAKHQVEEALRAAEVPFTVVLTGGFVEYSIHSPFIGIDVKNNTLNLVSDARTHSISLSSTKYIGAGYASIFAATPVEELAGRTIALVEVVANGEQIIAALTKKHGGVAPQVTVQSLHDVDEEIATSDFALAPLLRKKWGTGAFTVGSDIWEVKEYQRPSIEEVILAA